MGFLKYDFPDSTDPLKDCIKLSGKLAKIPEQDIKKIIWQTKSFEALICSIFLRSLNLCFQSGINSDHCPRIHTIKMPATANRRWIFYA